MREKAKPLFTDPNAMPKAGGEFENAVSVKPVPGNVQSFRNMVFYDSAGTEITDNISVIKCYDK